MNLIYKTGFDRRPLTNKIIPLQRLKHYMNLKTIKSNIDLSKPENDKPVGTIEMHAESNPLVSVIIRTKNRPDTLLYALKSVKDQEYRPLEIVIINDGGVDIVPVIASLPLTDIKLKLVVNKHSLGRTMAGNSGIDNASGEFIIFLDDDDWFEPGHINSLVNALKKHSDYLAAYAGVRYCASPENSDFLHIFNSEYDPVYLMLENTMPIHSVLFSKELVNRGCRLDESLKVFEDWDLWLQFAQYTDFYHVDQVSAGYRSGGESRAGWGITPEEVAGFRRQLLEKWRFIWNGEQLDKALHLSRQTLLTDLKKMDLKKIVTVNKILKQDYADLTSDHNNLKQDYAKLEHRLGLLGEEHQNLKYQHENLKYQHNNLKSEHNNLKIDHDIVLNSTSWRITAPWRYFGGKVKGFKRYGQRGASLLKTVCKSVQATHKINGTWLRLVKKITCHLKEDGLNGTLSRVKLHFNMQTAVRNQQNYYDNTFEYPCYPTDYELSHLPTFQIGIMAHIFYVDLFEEICTYLNNIPVPYNLMLSVVSKDDLDVVGKMAKKFLNNNAELIIKQVPNRGRDIAPMLVAFRKELEQCDIMAHIHTKKSSYNGSSRFGLDWRLHLLDSMFGSEEKIRATLAHFAANDRVGIIYPESFPGLPYWAFTWLSNRHHAHPLLKAMGIKDIDYNLYVDFPAGSMFWARTKAMKPLFELNLNYKDFPEEKGQIDNTIQHAIERCLVFSAVAAGMQHRLQYFRNNRPFFLAKNPSIIHQYCSDTIQNRILNAAELGSVISYDIFDTLFIRPFASPDAVLWMLDAKIKKQLNIPGFFHKRKNAENHLRQDLAQGKDVSITAIYQEISRKYNIAPDICLKMQKMEISAELAILKPRTSVSDTAKMLKSTGKRIILTSDMYLEISHIHEILAANDMDFFDSIYVSSDVGLRKDQGTIWQNVLPSENISENKLLHIGDNERSDIQILVDNKFLSPVHVMRPISLLAELKGGRELIQIFRKQQCWQNELVLGLIANRISNHIDRTPSDFAKIFSYPDIFGYTVIGPVLLGFISWLIKTAITDNITSLLFLSREGWLFNQIYERILNHPLMKHEKKKLPPGSYFYCSRTFAGLTAIETSDDFKILLSGDYHGSLMQLFNGRFGIENDVDLKKFLNDDILQQQVNLPQDYDKIHGYLELCLPFFKQQAMKYRQVFLKYWHEQAEETTSPAIVDIGYSGTIQKALMQILKNPITGYYLVTNTYCRQVINKGGKIDACFGNLLSDDQMNILPINKYALLTEAVLTAPQGQLKQLNMNPDGTIEPIFKPGGESQKHFDTIDKIHQGASDLISDVIDVTGHCFYHEAWNVDQTPDLLTLVIHRVLDIGDLGNKLSVEDDYSGNHELPVLNFYGSQMT